MDWQSYIGQQKLKERLLVHINSAKKRDEVLDHILLLAPPGYGKTTLARLIGQEAGVEFINIICPYDPNWMVRVVAGWNGILFMDEFHRLTVKQQEDLLPLIEEGYIQTKSMGKIQSGWLCIIAATTEPDQLITPLFERFPIIPKFEEYTDEEMMLIVSQKLEDVGIYVDDETAMRLSNATGGVPRLANQIATMARDLETTDADLILEVLQVTDDGLSADHVDYINVLGICGGTAGLKTIETHLRLPAGAIMNLERLLIRKGYLQYTKQGRTLTAKAYQNFNMPF